MEPYLLVLQARVLQWVVVLWVAYGLWLGQDPLTVAWRAAIGGYVAMRVSRWLLDRVARVMQDRLASEEAERQLREQTQAEAPAQATAPVVEKSAKTPVKSVIRPQPVAAAGGRA